MSAFNTFKRMGKGWLHKSQSYQFNALSCPKCKNELTDDGDYFYCSPCGFLVPKNWLIEVKEKLRSD